MRHFRVLAGLLLLTACTAGGAQRPRSAAPSSPGSAAPVIGFSGIVPAARRSPEPDVAAPLLGGGRLALASLRGHVVVVNFWASWCEPCRQETPALEQDYRALAARGVRFLGSDEADTPASARSFRAAHGVTYPSWSDPSGALLARFPGIPPAALPSTVLIDSQGRIAGTWIGPVTAAGLLTVLTSSQIS